MSVPDRLGFGLATKVRKTQALDALFGRNTSTDDAEDHEAPEPTIAQQHGAFLAALRSKVDPNTPT